MPTFVGGHSTQCCGAHSFRGFDEACERDPNLINAAMVAAPVGRMGDITLNGTQVRRRGMMQRLADLGFVLDAHWINSVHGSDVYRFTRCDTRRPLLAGPIAGNWNGMVIDQTLTGDLPRIQQGPNAGVPRNGRNRFQVGDRVRVNAGAGGRAGREFDVEGIVEDYNSYRVRMRDDRQGNAMFRISFNNVTLVQGVERRNEVNRPRPPVPHRHENAQVPALVNAPAAVPVVEANAGPVFSYYHCVFRDGRRGAGYQSLAEAIRNLGRRTRIDRCEILANGVTRWVNNIAH